MTGGARVGYLAASLACAALAVAAWQLVADLRLISPVYLPGPDRAFAALMRGFAKGDLIAQIGATVARMLAGWLVASLVGIALGALIGTSPRARVLLGPTLEFLRPMPASAIVPVAIALVGLSDQMILGVIAFGALWPMLLATVQGFAAVEPRLVDVGRALGFGPWRMIVGIALPSALPEILAGMRIGLTIALILSVVGEMLAGQPGLGLRILLAARAFNAADLYAGVILLGAIGIASNLAIGAVERGWRRA